MPRKSNLPHQGPRQCLWTDDAESTGSCSSCIIIQDSGAEHFIGCIAATYGVAGHSGSQEFKDWGWLSRLAAHDVQISSMLQRRVCTVRINLTARLGELRGKVT